MGSALYGRPYLRGRHLVYEITLLLRNVADVALLSPLTTMKVKSCPHSFLICMTASTRSRSRTDDVNTSNKKRKLEEDSDPDPTVVLQGQAGVGQHYDSLWLDDGNVIVACRWKAFKVHASILSHQLSVFKNLLSGPALVALMERLEGCPVLRMDDEGDALARLLQILYDGGKRCVIVCHSSPRQDYIVNLSSSDWFRQKKRKIHFEDFRKVVIIAAKYQVQAVMDEAVARLSEYYPSSSLSDWASTVFTDEDKDGDSPDAGSLDISRADSFAVVSLARLLNAPSILPTALYQCSKGTDVELLLHSINYDDEIVRLSKEDLQLCLSARRRLLEGNSRIFRPLLEFRSQLHPELCSTKPACRKAVDQIVLNALDIGVANTAFTLEDLGSWLTNVQVPVKDPRKKKLCVRCDRTLQGAIRKRQEGCWNELGDIFNVKPWPVQRDDRVEGQVSSRLHIPRTGLSLRRAGNIS